MATSNITSKAKAAKARAALANRTKVSAARAETRRAIRWLGAASALLAPIDDEVVKPLAASAAALVGELEALAKQMSEAAE